MALRIKKNHGIFEINGSIIAENAKSLQHHFEQLLFTEDRVVLSVDHVERIDISGVNVLSNLYKRAMKSNKVFYIIGKENLKIKKAFGKVNYILRKDFI